MRTPRALAGRRAKVALLLATVAVAFTTASCASTGSRGGQTATPTILSVPNLGTFSISGGPARLMAPGTTQPLDLVITNGNDFAIEVTRIAATVQDAATKGGELNRACVGSQHMSVSRPFTGPVVVPANATTSLSQLDTPAEQWPQISMLNLTTNQDACKDTSFELTYAGTATR